MYYPNDIPQQSADSGDCGIYALLWCHLIALQCDTCSFRQNDMDRARIGIANFLFEQKIQAPNYVVRHSENFIDRNKKQMTRMEVDDDVCIIISNSDVPKREEALFEKTKAFDDMEPIETPPLGYTTTKSFISCVKMYQERGSMRIK